MSASRTDLSAFATALAARLPGTWTSEYHRHAAYENQFPTIERLWDAAHVDYIVSQYVLGHDAVLNGPDGQQLYVTDRPLYRHQFVVAPLEPEGFETHQITPVREPNGIAVRNDPVRAAAAVVRRVLPRYRAALDAVRHNARIQPEPPHRQPAPEVAQTVTLVWYPDGVVGAPYGSVPEEARMTLFGCRFQYSPNEAAFVLPASYSSKERALLVQLVALRLTAQGIGVNFRRAAPLPSPPESAAVSKALTTVPAAPRSATRR
ncbi:hypothetical protein PV416_07980 [Streptomyces ipomoeae]|jgi:hypothetical protein|uniref:hypothetical protein n=1 Tax=Streptomyces ipomoeae TaxID=103232 RepID=UPI0029B7EFD3|nr:hypothetical protein [Streptomyces ipomoeae]MDX2821029.1 hypothetical protein [Streptomyces ipomoeae]MDX2874462.1 hypothetical protein [Streptomyces ipomoeae]